MVNSLIFAEGIRTNRVLTGLNFESNAPAMPLMRRRMS
jgi:hypothetical protein